MQDEIFTHAMTAEARALRTAVGVPSQDTVVCMGRVCCDADHGKLNATSVLLEGGRDDGGHRVKLSLAELGSYALFPGQYVAVEGINSSGGRMVVQKLCEGVCRPLPSTPRQQLLASPLNRAPLRMMVACGPFCCTDNLDYQPLKDLLARAATIDPVEVLVLCGPFVDVHHPQIAKGSPELLNAAGDGYEPVDFHGLFAFAISGLIEDIYRDRPDLNLQIVLVPSLHDAQHDYVYPQPPLADRVPGGVPSPFDDALFALGIPFTAEGPDKRVHCVSNPALLCIGELVIGVSSTDVLFDLGREEIAQNPVSSNRITRLAEHLVMQQSFYPLFPTSGQDAVPLDMRFNDQWRLPVSPDILITPSKLATFARPLRNGTLAVNPGQLARGVGGGTFADFTIFPLREEDLSTGEASRHKASERSQVSIRRV
jgi:DNA polymerase alpha subunit B